MRSHTVSKAQSVKALVQPVAMFRVGGLLDLQGSKCVPTVLCLANCPAHKSHLLCTNGRLPSIITGRLSAGITTNWNLEMTSFSQMQGRKFVSVVQCWIIIVKGFKLVKKMWFYGVTSRSLTYAWVVHFLNLMSMNMPTVSRK